MTARWLLIPIVFALGIAGFVLTQVFRVSDQFSDVAVRSLQRCAAARDLLGEPIAKTPMGCGCTQFSVGNGQGNGQGTLPVSGAHASGRFEYTAEIHGNRITLTSGTLFVGKQMVDVQLCNTPDEVPATPPIADAAAGMDRRCEAGEPGACIALGYMFEMGTGVPRDAARARNSYDRACRMGLAPACAKRDAVK